MGAAVDVQLAVDVANVVLGSAEGDDQGLGDLAVRKMLCDLANKPPDLAIRREAENRLRDMVIVP